MPKSIFIREIQRWPCTYRWTTDEQKNNHHTRRITVPGTGTITQQLFMNWEGKAASMWANYWVNTNADIENIIKHCSTCLYFQQKQPKEQIIHHDVPGKLWEFIVIDMFPLYNKHYLYREGFFSFCLVTWFQLN